MPRPHICPCLLDPGSEPSQRAPARPPPRGASLAPPPALCPPEKTVQGSCLNTKRVFLKIPVSCKITQNKQQGLGEIQGWSRPAKARQLCNRSTHKDVEWYLGTNLSHTESYGKYLKRTKPTERTCQLRQQSWCAETVQGDVGLSRSWARGVVQPAPSWEPWAARSGLPREAWVQELF